MKRYRINHNESPVTHVPYDPLLEEADKKLAEVDEVLGRVKKTIIKYESQTKSERELAKLDMLYT